MQTWWKLIGLAIAVGLSGSIHAQTVVINGKTVPITALIQKGRPMVDAISLLKALGINATWDAKAKKLSIVTAKRDAPSGGVQLPGDWGQFGVSYKLGDADPVVFSLLDAEFTVARVSFGDTTVAPAADEKLLVLHYSLQNPQPTDMYANWTTLHFVAVDAGDENREYAQCAALEDTKARLDLYLKPAQKVHLYTVIKAPARGPVPKLIVQPSDGKVVRYDLRNKVKPLPPPISDPTDASGSSAREEVPAPTGQFYPMGQLDVQFVGAAYTTRTLWENSPGEGKRFLLVTFKVRNGTPGELSVNWSNFAINLQTAADRTLEWSGFLLHDTLDEPVELKMRPGEESTVRTYIELPLDDAGKMLSIQEKENSRTYLFDVIGAR